MLLIIVYAKHRELYTAREFYAKEIHHQRDGTHP